MRHRRLKQLVTYKYGSGKKAKQIYKKKKSDAIYFGKRGGSISTIDLGNMWGILDPTFEWHRDYRGMNIVSFNRNGETFKTYVIKGRN